jgi:hypothetical protein
LTTGKVHTVGKFASINDTGGQLAAKVVSAKFQNGTWREDESKKSHDTVPLMRQLHT